MLPGYLWQMPLSQGCSLQPIHGCCGIRLPCRFWPTLPKPLRSSIVPPLPINQARLPNLAYKNGHFDSHSWDFWNGLKSTPAPLFLSTLRLPLSISALSCIPHSLRFSLPLPFSLSLCLAVIGLIFFFFVNPVQKSQWESTKLYLSAAELGPAWTLDPLFGFTCSHLCFLLRNTE